MRNASLAYCSILLAVTVLSSAAEPANDWVSSYAGSAACGRIARAELASADNWLAMVASSEQTAPADEQAYEPWRTRVGPAYSGRFWPSFGRDALELPYTVCDDFKAVVTSPVSWIGFGLAGAAGIAINGSGADDRVARHFSRNGHQLPNFLEQLGDVGGNPGAHFALTGAAYLAALARGDIRTYENSKTMLNALSINGLVTLALKVAVRTESPNGDEFGWPSGHTSSTFCVATVLYHQYGPWVGVPMMAFASFVGYERIDARNHDFSDVISGAFIGIVIGHAVAQNHEARIMGMDVVPYVSPHTGAVGVALSKQW